MGRYQCSLYVLTNLTKPISHPLGYYYGYLLHSLTSRCSVGMRGIPVSEKYRGIKSDGITVGLLNTVRSILRKSLHVDEISSRSSA